VLGKRSTQRGLFEADTMYLEFVGRESFYGWLASERGKLFRDEDFADLYCLDNGRESIAPSLLATALVLQAHDRVSDAEVKARADYDIRWKVALGIEVKDRPFAKSTLQVFRGQLIIHEKARMMFRRSLGKAKESGFLRRRKKLHVAVDTMAILGAGAVKDTYNLLADGVRKLVRVLAELKGDEPAQWAADHGLERYFAPSIKGTEEVDWEEEEARRQFLAGIVQDADRLLEIARTERGRFEEGSDEDGRIVEASELLRQLLSQDIERKESGAQIKEGVAKDRVVSVHDPEMRHGHKCSTGRFEGHKGAVAVDSQSQLITAVEVIAGNAYDGDTGLSLTVQSEENTGLEAAETVGDCAYGDGETRRQFKESGRKLEAPVAQPSARGKFPKTSFIIGRKEDRVTCPAGCRTFQWNWRTLPPNRSGRRYRVRVFTFPKERCAECPLRTACVGNRDGPRTISLHPQEEEMRRARGHQKSQAFREAKRHRQVAEHRIARLRQLGLKQARYMGRAKTLFQLLLAATVANLSLVAGVAATACGVLSFLFALLAHLGRHLRASARHTGLSESWWCEGFSPPPLTFAPAPSLRPFALRLKNGAFRPHF